MDFHYQTNSCSKRVNNKVSNQLSVIIPIQLQVKQDMLLTYRAVRRLQEGRHAKQMLV